MTLSAPRASSFDPDMLLFGEYRALDFLVAVRKDPEPIYYDVLLDAVLGQDYVLEGIAESLGRLPPNLPPGYADLRTHLTELCILGAEFREKLEEAGLDESSSHSNRDQIEAILTEVAGYSPEEGRQREAPATERQAPRLAHLLDNVKATGARRTSVSAEDTRANVPSAKMKKGRWSEGQPRKDRQNEVTAPPGKKVEVTLQEKEAAGTPFPVGKANDVITPERKTSRSVQRKPAAPPSLELIRGGARPGEENEHDDFVSELEAALTRSIDSVLPESEPIPHPSGERPIEATVELDSDDDLDEFLELLDESKLFDDEGDAETERGLQVEQKAAEANRPGPSEDEPRRPHGLERPATAIEVPPAPTEKILRPAVDKGGAPDAAEKSLEPPPQALRREEIAETPFPSSTEDGALTALTAGKPVQEGTDEAPSPSSIEDGALTALTAGKPVQEGTDEALSPTSIGDGAHVALTTGKFARAVTTTGYPTRPPGHPTAAHNQTFFGSNSVWPGEGWTRKDVPLQSLPPAGLDLEEASEEPTPPPVEPVQNGPNEMHAQVMSIVDQVLETDPEDLEVWLEFLLGAVKDPEVAEFGGHKGIAWLANRLKELMIQHKELTREAKLAKAVAQGGEKRIETLEHNLSAVDQQVDSLLELFDKLYRAQPIAWGEISEEDLFPRSPKLVLSLSRVAETVESWRAEHDRLISEAAEARREKEEIQEILEDKKKFIAHQDRLLSQAEERFTRYQRTLRDRNDELTHYKVLSLWNYLKFSALELRNQFMASIGHKSLLGRRKLPPASEIIAMIDKFDTLERIYLRLEGKLPTAELQQVDGELRFLKTNIGKLRKLMERVRTAQGRRGKPAQAVPQEGSAASSEEAEEAGSSNEEGEETEGSDEEGGSEDEESLSSEDESSDDAASSEAEGGTESSSDSDDQSEGTEPSEEEQSGEENASSPESEPKADKSEE